MDRRLSWSAKRITRGTEWNWVKRWQPSKHVMLRKEESSSVEGRLQLVPECHISRQNQQNEVLRIWNVAELLIILKWKVNKCVRWTFHILYGERNTKAVHFSALTATSLISEFHFRNWYWRPSTSLPDIYLQLHSFTTPRHLPVEQAIPITFSSVALSRRANLRRRTR